MIKKFFLLLVVTLLSLGTVFAQEEVKEKATEEVKKAEVKEEVTEESKVTGQNATDTAKCKTVAEPGTTVDGEKSAEEATDKNVEVQ